MELEKKVKQGLRLLFGLTNIAAPAIDDEEIHSKMQSEAMQLNYKIKAFIGASSSNGVENLDICFQNVKESIGNIVKLSKKIFSNSLANSQDRDNMKQEELDAEIQGFNEKSQIAAEFNDEESANLYHERATLLVKQKEEAQMKESSSSTSSSLNNNNRSSFFQVEELMMKMENVVQEEKVQKSKDEEELKSMINEKKVPTQGWKRVQLTEYQRSQM